MYRNKRPFDNNKQRMDDERDERKAELIAIVLVVFIAVCLIWERV